MVRPPQWGESLLGYGREVDDFAYLHFAAGFGGGLIRNGERFAASAATPVNSVACCRPIMSPHRWAN